MKITVWVEETVYDIMIPTTGDLDHIGYGMPEMHRALVRWAFQKILKNMDEADRKESEGHG